MVHDMCIQHLNSKVPFIKCGYYIYTVFIVEIQTAFFKKCADIKLEGKETYREKSNTAVLEVVTLCPYYLAMVHM